ncbi:MAG: hypothetical protein E6J15_05735 [Chloroflexi bacterium]|nr:MAG: hypothetical protein E6J15_05735 [Chloroflexota bacterium]
MGRPAVRVRGCLHRHRPYHRASGDRVTDTTIPRGTPLWVPRIRPWLGIAAAAWLWTKNPLFDAIAVASAEIGVLFTGLFLVAGSIWAKPTWGVWWTWEPRLVTTAIMFVMYVGYLLLRGLSTDFSRRATRAAVFGIIAVIDVPIVHLSVLWANSLHQLPTVLRAGGSPALDAPMLLTLMISLGAYTLIYTYFMSARVSLELARQGRLWTT